MLRALLYIRMPEGVVDERGFNLLRRMREEAGKGLTLAAFKKLLREQFFTLLLDERRAVEAIPAMLDRDPDLSSRMASNLRRMIDVVGVNTTIAKARLAEIEDLFRTMADGQHQALPLKELAAVVSRLICWPRIMRQPRIDGNDRFVTPEGFEPNILRRRNGEDG